MSTSKTFQNIIHTITHMPQKIIDYISGAVIRIFGPTKDEWH